MDRTALHLELRNALGLSDELSRHTHARGDDMLTGHFQALETQLRELERVVGQAHDGELAAQPVASAELERMAASLARLRARVPAELRGRVRVLLGSVRRVARGVASPRERVPSKPFFALPLARVLPQVLHSAIDLAAGLALLASSGLARTTAGRAAGAVLGGVTLGSLATSDTDAAPVKALSVETHEKIDWTTGALAAVLPFALGYAKKDPVVAAIHVGCGLATLASSLVTDYRATNGVTHPRRSHGGPHRDARLPPMADAQGRPLEGLASAGTNWNV